MGLRGLFEPVRADFKPERAGFGVERVNFGPERFYFEHEQTEFKLVKAGGEGWTEGQTDRYQEIHPYVPWDIGPLGPLPKKV